MDGKEKVGSLDMDRINIHENYEVEYWAKTLGISSEQLKNAVTAVGTSTDEVRKYIKR